jgi:hypothetical protein
MSGSMRCSHHQQAIGSDHSRFQSAAYSAEGFSDGHFGAASVQPSGGKASQSRGTFFGRRSVVNGAPFLVRSFSVLQKFGEKERGVMQPRSGFPLSGYPPGATVGR